MTTNRTLHVARNFASLSTAFLVAVLIDGTRGEVCCALGAPAVAAIAALYLSDHRP